MQIAYGGLDEALPGIGIRVLDALLQLDEVCFAIVELIAVEVMEMISSRDILVRSRPALRSAR